MSLYYINSISLYLHSISAKLPYFPAFCEDLRVIVFGNALLYLSFILSHSPLLFIFSAKLLYFRGLRGCYIPVYLGMILLLFNSLSFYFFIFILFVFPSDWLIFGVFWVILLLFMASVRSWLKIK